MAAESKDTIYVDVDDEITAVIDKVLASPNKIVALVLPKRATVFQSTVNMKLLKRKSEQAKKSLVLVTTEASLLPLAGAVGLHVSKTLASKPEIPEAPEKEDQFVDADKDEPINLEDNKDDEDVDLDAISAVAIGKLAKDAKEPETIELDNENLEDEQEEKPTKKPKKNKNLAVPNFEKFRLWIFLGLGAFILLIFLIILGTKILPRATIDIKTNAQSVNTSVNLTLSSTATKADLATNTIPAKQVTESKTYTATVNATGQQSAQAAKGPITFTDKVCHSPYKPGNVPIGTTVTQGGFSYVTQSSIASSDFILGPPSGGCYVYTASTTIVASSSGASSNVSTTTFIVNIQNMTATGSASGGQNPAQVVSQADINSAKNQISSNFSAVQTDLQTQLTQAGYIPITVTFSAGAPTVTSNPPVGGAGTSVTVTEAVTFTMYGAKRTDLNALLVENIKSQVNTDQAILTTGLNSGTYTVGSSPTSLTLQTKAIVGPDIAVKQLRQKIRGYKSGQVQALLLQNPNVKSVTVHFSPFFVSKVPSNINHITINVAKPSTK